MGIDQGAGIDPALIKAVHDKLAANPDGVIESIARELGVSTQLVLQQLPASECRIVGHDKFETVWNDVASWGEILFIIHTVDLVLECAGALPSGSYGRGYYNFHGDSPVSGHLKADACVSIAFVDRLFHGRRACSIQFFNSAGEAVFKIFVRRNAKRDLLSAQVEKFERLRSQLIGAPLEDSA